MVQRLEADFKVTLQQQNSLEDWAIWLKGVVTQVLKPFEEKPTFATAARQFLLKWSFYRYIKYSSFSVALVIRKGSKRLNVFMLFFIVQWLFAILL